jgi:hypothetical protein
MRKSIVFLAGVIFLSGFAGSAFAQDKSEDKSQDKSKAKVRTVTGCLTKGVGGDEYLLAARNGSTWEVHSKDSTKDSSDASASNRVSLSDHVGQTVTATGVVEHSAIHNMKEGVKDTATATGVKKDNREHGHLIVTSLKMVSVSCSSHRHTEN